MRIDRSRFFILTTALAAASGCTVINEQSADSGAATDSGTTTDSGGGDATLDSGTDTAPGETSSETSSEAGDTSDASTDGDGATCTDDVPAPSDCATILTGTGCHDTTGTLPTPADNSCGNWVADLKPREAKAAQDCLTAAMNAAADPDAGIGPTCEGIDWSNCALDALGTSCTDDTAAVYCEGILTACAAVATDAGDASGTPPTTLTDCTTLAAGLTDAGRTAIQTCVMEGGCAVPLRDCIKGL